MHRAQAAGAAGRFVVAAIGARLTRVTQGKRFFTLWIRSLVLNQHAAWWAKNRVNLKNVPAYGTFRYT
jgi:hypothetical protein